MERTANNSNMLLRSFAAALIACACGVALVALSAFVMQKQWLPFESLPYINIGIKLVSAAAAALISCRKASDRAPLRGALSGALYMAVSFVIFSLICGSFELSSALLFDLLICAGVGFVIGILHNLKS